MKLFNSVILQSIMAGLSLICLVAPLIIDASQQSRISYIDDGFSIDGKYSWSPSVSDDSYFIPINALEGADIDRYAWFNNNHFEPDDTFAEWKTGLTWFNLDDRYLWGDIGWRWVNVGEYEGQVVDIEIIFEGADDVRSNEYAFTKDGIDRYNAPSIYVMSNKDSSGESLSTIPVIYIGHSHGYAINPVMSVSFYETGTDTPISITGNVTMFASYSRRYYIDESIDRIYLRSGTTISEFEFTGKNYIGREVSVDWLSSTNKEAYITLVLDNTSTFEIGLTDTCTEVSTSNSYRWMASGYSINAAVGRYTTPSLTKHTVFNY